MNVLTFTYKIMNTPFKRFILILQMIGIFLVFLCWMPLLAGLFVHVPGVLYRIGTITGVVSLVFQVPFIVSTFKECLRLKSELKRLEIKRIVLDCLDNWLKDLGPEGK